MTSSAGILTNTESITGTMSSGFPDGYTISNTTTITDAKNFAFGSATGTKFGTSATAQKLGFFNATPVVQPTSASQSAVATTALTTAAGIYGFTTAAQGAAIITLLNQIRSDLVTLGLIKGS